MNQPTTIPHQRERWFKAIAVALPFVLLLLLEGILRLAGYGQSYPLFVASEDYADHWVMNLQVSEKYFLEQANATVGYQEAFPMEKDSNAFRIFVLGASTAVGYPYLYNGSFHRWLQYRLNRTFPDKNIEIINLALTAVNSYTVLDFAQQLIDYEPDAVLIYAGHNEYYGALGVGSTTTISSNPTLVRLALELREYRIVQLITSALNLFKPSVLEPDLQENLMKRMTAEQAIAYNSDLYQKGIQQYQENMTAALSFLSEQGISTFVSTLVSNKKDLPPFISDSTLEKSAQDYYELGKTAYNQQDFALAKQHFVQAKELDQLRFRAPEAMNDIIRQLAEQLSEVYLVDAQERLQAFVPNGIIGQEVLLEHVHPNLLGYSLLADAFYQTLRAEDMISEDWQQASTWQQAHHEMPITEVDSLKGSYEVMILKEGWPFYQPITDLDTTNRSLPEAIAGALAVQQISWQEAMERLYQYYYQNQSYEEALRVAEAVTLERPQEPQFFTKAAGLALELDRIQKADYLFQRALRLESSVPLARKIAINFIKADALEAASPYLQFVMEKEPTDLFSFRLAEAIESVQDWTEESVSLQNDTEKMTRIAESYLLLGKQDTAEVYLQRVLAQKPTHTQALNLMKMIQK
ncbi:MAG: SGNH/GDSL hydrolase family protein [Bacteroidota bacterium]